ncbi:two-component system response regulator [Facilibium subflavum]|uniref:two-component system response regulator n=1 Tax=Facilibium subflavum TaxID=2219058 RepID=UPI0013C339E4|nr:EAL domain-containing protein [Facilibium subflavum]
MQDNKDIPKAKILIVDDNEKNLYAMESVLKSVHANIYLASDGKEALKLVLRHDFALIFLDVQMPEMDGYEVAKCLKQNQSSHNIPIIFVTAISYQQKNILEGYQSGGVDYLMKPIEPSILIAKTNIFIQLYESKAKLKETISKLNQIASTDPLTGLPNRNQFNLFFNKLLAMHQRHNHQFALLLLDLDNFKAVNDLHGHDTGDKLLIAVAKRLMACVRQSDHVARIGGDEYTILLPQIQNVNDVNTVAKNLLHSFAKSFVINKHPFKITTSIGIAFYPHAGRSTEGIFKAADIALYKAKEQGRNCFIHFSGPLNKIYQRQLRIERDLPQAIQNKEISISYQPRHDLQTNKITGAEILARWHHPKLGNISPVEFINIAETSGHIYTLGCQIINEAFDQIAKWQKKFGKLFLHFSFNLSVHQLFDMQFHHDLQSLADQYNINLHDIEIELTESVFSSDVEKLDAMLQNLHQLGVRCSIDDFGTGYSCISRLKLLPIQILKIDQSFIQHIHKSSDDDAIIKAIIALATSLKFRIIAEGIENKEQLLFLQKHGCHEAQGYYYAKPLIASEFENYYQKQIKR